MYSVVAQWAPGSASSPLHYNITDIHVLLVGLAF